jgi:catechol 2,3-dioxygenase-like lactoylglutathione lyase family enzyme
MLHGVHHVALNVSDVAASDPFFVGILGLRPLDRPDFGFPGAWYELPDGRQIHLIEVADWTAPTGQHVALRVDDIAATVEWLRERGATVSDAFTVPGAGQQAFLEDPDGNVIELNEPIAWSQPG